MSILMLVSEHQENLLYNNIDDIIGIFRDNHPFSEYELLRFNFMVVTGLMEDVQTRLDQVRPIIADAFYSTELREYTFNRPNIVGLRIIVWSTLKPPIRWYELNDDDKYVFKVGDLTQAEKDFLADPEFDINDPTNDNYIDKFVKDLGRKPANTTEIRDLRGELP